KAAVRRDGGLDDAADELRAGRFERTVGDREGAALQRDGGAERNGGGRAVERTALDQPVGGVDEIVEARPAWPEREDVLVRAAHLLAVDPEVSIRQRVGEVSALEVPRCARRHAV